MGYRKSNPKNPTFSNERYPVMYMGLYINTHGIVTFCRSPNGLELGQASEIVLHLTDSGMSEMVKMTFHFTNFKPCVSKIEFANLYYKDKEMQRSML